MPKYNDDIVREFEGLHNKAYLDPGGIQTIGWGHTGPEVHLGQEWTDEQCEAQLQRDMADSAAAVDRLIERVCTQGQYDALVDFVFNDGAAALAKSDLLSLFNAGDVLGSARQFTEWDEARVNGSLEVMQGLVRRKTAELVRFMSIGSEVPQPK